MQRKEWNFQMRKKIFGRQLARGKDSRKALFRSVIRALVINGRITTTKARARSVQGQIDKIINIAKKDTLSSRKLILAKLGNDEEVVKIIINKYASSLKDRTSGYTKLIHLPRRSGDAAEMVKMEFVDTAKAVETEPKPKKKPIREKKKAEKK